MILKKPKQKIKTIRVVMLEIGKDYKSIKSRTVTVYDCEIEDVIKKIADFRTYNTTKTIRSRIRVIIMEIGNDYKCIKSKTETFYNCEIEDVVKKIKDK